MSNYQKSILSAIIAIGLIMLLGAVSAVYPPMASVWFGGDKVALAAASSGSFTLPGETSFLIQSPDEGQALFQEKCVACHTVGSGILVGPDLQGVTARRDRDWLARWIKGPDKVLAEGDPTATQMLSEFNNVPMPNLGLTEQQVEALIAYLQTTETSAAPAPTALPALYVPTLVAAVVVLLALTALGLGVGKKQVEVRL